MKVEDIAKRLQDYGFHAPTMSWPVAGTLMIEPTESESKAELDRFCDAMIAIRAGDRRHRRGPPGPRRQPAEERAAHRRASSRRMSGRTPIRAQHAAFPLPWVAAAKYWPPVKRVDNVYGDRHLVCTCAPLEAYAQAAE